MLASAAFSLGVDRVLRNLRPYSASGAASFPRTADASGLRRQSSENLHTWFVRVINTFSPNSTKGCAVETILRSSLPCNGPEMSCGMQVSKCLSRHAISTTFTWASKLMLNIFDWTWTSERLATPSLIRFRTFTSVTAARPDSLWTADDRAMSLHRLHRLCVPALRAA